MFGLIALLADNNDGGPRPGPMGRWISLNPISGIDTRIFPKNKGNMRQYAQNHFLGNMGNIPRITF